VDFGEINLLPGSSVNSGEEITRLVFGPPCDYTAALNRAKEILRIDPADEWLTRNYSTLEQSAQREPDAKRALAKQKL